MLVTAEVLQRSRSRFEAEALPPFTVKGKSQPVQAFSLGSLVGLRDRATRYARMPLIGRDTELADLRDALAAVEREQGRVVAVVGPTGISKSRLLEEARAHAGDLATVAVVCEQYEASTPYWAVRWLLRRVLDIPFDASPGEAGGLLGEVVVDVAPGLAEWLPLLALPVDAEVPSTPATEGLDPEFRRAQTVKVTAEFLGRVLTDPTLIVFEDAYWMDDASRAVVRRLCEEAAERPWLLLLSSRDEEPDLAAPEEEHTRTIRLRPLGEDAAEELAAAATEESPLTTHQLRTVAQRAEGSPLFLLEMLAMAASTAPAGDALPDTIEAAIGARIDTLSPGDRLRLRCAAVLGAIFPVGLADVVLRAASTDTDASTMWEPLGEFLVTEPGGRLRFQHNLVRDVAYEGLPYRRRRDLHAAVARHLEEAAGDQAEASAELLSLHYFHGERYEPAFRFARLAGDRARGKAATAEAAGFYRRALEAAGHAAIPVDVSAAVAEDLGDVAELAGLYDDGARAYRTARRLRHRDPVRGADLLRKEGLIHERAGRYTAARRLYRSGLHLLGRPRGRRGPEPPTLPQGRQRRPRPSVRGWRCSPPPR